MEEGLRFHGSGEGSFWGEGDLAPTRYEWGGGGGGNWEGSGTMSYGRICMKCEGGYSSTPAFRLLGLGLCTEGRG